MLSARLDSAMFQQSKHVWMKQMAEQQWNGFYSQKKSAARIFIGKYLQILGGDFTPPHFEE